MSLLKKSLKWILSIPLFLIYFLLLTSIFRAIFKFYLSLYLPVTGFWELWGKLSFFGDGFIVFALIALYFIAQAGTNKVMSYSPKPLIFAKAYIAITTLGIISKMIWSYQPAIIIAIETLSNSIILISLISFAMNFEEKKVECLTKEEAVQETKDFLTEITIANLSHNKKKENKGNTSV